MNRRTRWGFSPRAAQKDPNAYRGLVVKEAGYSAHLADLGRSIQEDIIGRYEFGSAL